MRRLHDAREGGGGAKCNVESIIRVVIPRVCVEDVCHCNTLEKLFTQSLLVK